MKLIYKCIFSSICLLGFLGNSVFAQTDPMYSQYRFNALVINPAQAGAQNQVDASFLSRWQWVGIPGAPRTMSFSLNAPVKENFGLGVTIVRDEVGPVQNTNFAINGAYHLPITNKYIFALGLNGMLGNTSVDLAKLTTIDKNDNNFEANLSTGMNLNTGWGLLLYSKALYVGVSQPRILKYSFENRNNTSVDYADHFFLYGGWNKKLTETIEIRPSALLKMAQDAPLGVDVNIMASFYQKIDAGFTYHHNDAIGLIIGYNYNDKLYFGYAYDLPTTSIYKGTHQTHEIALRFKIKDSFKHVSNPRYFN